MAVACVLLGVALAAAVVRVVFLRRAVRRLRRDLDNIVSTETNALVTTETTDPAITALAHSINRMLERGRLDLIERIRAEAELRHTLTNISHDLRTPLTAAQGYVQMAESASLDPATRQRYLGIARERLSALSGLLNALFEFTRVVEGTTKLAAKPVDVAEATRQCLAAFSPQLREKGFRIEALIPDQPVYRLGDEEALRRVLQNLLANVAVHGCRRVRVRVDDSGIDIANDVEHLERLDIPHLFDRFYTADTSRTNQTTGLGLAIAKELLTRMGASIVARTADGMLTMYMVLPAVPTSSER